MDIPDPKPTYSQDGDLMLGHIITYKDGSSIVNGKVQLPKEDKVTECIFTTTEDGELVETVVIDLKKRITFVENADGAITVYPEDGNWFMIFPPKADGSQKTYFSDGTEVCNDAGGKDIPCK